jgi:peptidyl-prolyl cis-trans isomerase SurA
MVQKPLVTNFLFAAPPRLKSVTLKPMPRVFLAGICLLLFSPFFAQQKVIDQVIAVVGKYPVLLSDLQNAMLEREKEALPLDKCQALEMIVYQKLLVAQADKDSVTVTDNEVDAELNRRMAYFIQQFGSEEKLEQFYGKRTNVLKDELRSDVQEQLLADKMEGKVNGDVKLTPAEVREFYNSIPQDSLPLIGSEVELRQLVKKPTASAESKKQAKELIESYRQRVMSGQSSISTLARLYSEDPGSAMDGGLYTNIPKGKFDPAFEAVAFRLKKGEVSNVFESAFGYHFMELIQRKGELVDIRHILIVPKVTPTDYIRCKKKLDSIYADIQAGRITFEEAVTKYSDDAETKQNQGLMINPVTASTRFDHETLAQIDPKLVALINEMKVDDVSAPMEFAGPDGKPGYRILKLKNRIDPHKANLKEDYQRMMLMATAARKSSEMKAWIKSRSRQTYIRIDPGFTCQFTREWTITN